MVLCDFCRFHCRATRDERRERRRWRWRVNISKINFPFSWPINCNECDEETSSHSGQRRYWQDFMRFSINEFPFFRDFVVLIAIAILEAFRIETKQKKNVKSMSKWIRALASFSWSSKQKLKMLKVGRNYWIFKKLKRKNYAGPFCLDLSYAMAELKTEQKSIFLEIQRTSIQWIDWLISNITFWLQQRS